MAATSHFGGFSKDKETDAYGFKKPEDLDEKQYDKFVNDYVPVLERRNAKWEQFVNAQGDKLPEGFLEKRKLKRFVRKGIPMQMRPRLWMLISGAQDTMDACPGEYDRLVNTKPDPQVASAIDLDLNRTYPDNEYFRSAPGSLQGELRLVLTAFGNKNPHIGYCQGLNFLAGMILLMLKDAEQTFWLLHVVIENIPDYYSMGMLGIRVDMAVLKDLIRQQAPEVGAIFDKHGFDPAMLVTKWFVCWFLETLPIETSLRVWDCFFNEGSKILFRCALTLIISNRKRFAACKTFPNITDLFKQITADAKVLECHKFMQDLFQVSGSLPSKTIDTLRRKHEKIFESELAA